MSSLIFSSLLSILCLIRVGSQSYKYALSFIIELQQKKGFDLWFVLFWEMICSLLIMRFLLSL
ncbi:hypothetical protein H1P_190014 [Hyella patelloides LEGE 07179]|uniref:Uncharacterized protein n=1 Tax=Hyella patelloides LEGE 07179 TaxID=945734 RepID=A0A563VPE2_9CYAN|nr:hypothetical protein H1P_190014 [Hyella patelloides LEGE 07179]